RGCRRLGAGQGLGGGGAPQRQRVVEGRQQCGVRPAAADRHGLQGRPDVLDDRLVAGEGQVGEQGLGGARRRARRQQAGRGRGSLRGGAGGQLPQTQFRPAGGLAVGQARRGDQQRPRRLAPLDQGGGRLDAAGVRRVAELLDQRL